MPALTVILVTICAIVLAGCASSTVPESLSVRPTDSPQHAARIASDPNLQAGQAAYNLRCAHCHGYAGEGQLASTVENTLNLGMSTVPPHDATGHSWRHPNQLLRQVILQGIQNPLDHFPMPPFEGVMTEAEIDQVLDYLRLWWTDEQREFQRQVTAKRDELDVEFGME